jgi:hypothetical protein
METKKLKIKKMFAFIATDENGKEWLPSVQDQRGFMFPLFGADRETIDRYKSDAKIIATTTGHKITLVEFSVRTDLEII